MAESARDRVTRAYARLSESDRPEAWIHLRPMDEVLADADAVDSAVGTATDAGRDLPLAGTVFAVKDNIDVAGLPTTAACPGYARTPDRTATSVRRLLDAGAVLLGKTNLDQFATGLVGTRSPYGACRSAHDPQRISGGSSSGSAVVVALGIADFALGTDTAGSGRVPAALNGIVGMKATVGLVPVDGVVPACPSYDCVTAFAPTLPDVVRVMRIMTGPSERDPASRVWPADTRLAAPPAPRVAIPLRANLDALSAEARSRFDEAVDLLRGRGVLVGELDITEFLDAAKLLYDGALVAERYASFGDYVEQPLEGTDPTVRTIALNAREVTGAELVRDQQRVRARRLRTRTILGGFDALLVPTAPEHPTIAQVQADPIGVNARLGRYTNFMNLLDMAGVAVPAGAADGGVFGVTVVTRAFDDQVGLDVAGLLTGTAPGLYPDLGCEVIVFGAHMRGFPLCDEMVRRGGRFVTDVATSPHYAMYALPGDIPKPAVVRTSGAGTSLAGEMWLLPSAGLGSFLAELPPPMTLGKIELADGRWVTGFGCSAPAGTDISDFGGWRAYSQVPSRRSPAG
ncbi:allophanate hydrolase [Phytoactinopolyspora halotolerans]|uniref:Allophanate hydrolase n=1 Tax=Phytoactinopolyspora halotolerans TaxID=1981512 RepID=A0A6L9SGB1_9ACTN|nr:allophanate hydrolase [Phytoactinopolyspora halotolerans]NEE04159.1 allophanate hydrolase [Phytoactinopolyspora halotolerans]